MKLTNAHREAYIAAVAKHLPALPDFDSQAQFNEPVRKAAESVLPAEVLAFAKKYPRYVHRIAHNLKYLSKDEQALFSGRAPYALTANYIPAEADFDAQQRTAREAATTAALAEFEAWCQRRRDRLALLNRLREVTQSATTDKALRELLPEFAELVPTEPAKARQLPVANTNAVMADLIKAGLKVPVSQSAAAPA